MTDKLIKLLNTQAGSIFPGEKGEMGEVWFQDGSKMRIDDFVNSCIGKVPIVEFVAMFVEIGATYGNNRRPKNPEGDKTTQRQFKQRFLEGYDLQDWRKIIVALHEDKWHSEPNNGHVPYYYADMEYITRSDNAEKYFQRYNMYLGEGVDEKFNKLSSVYDSWSKETGNIYWKEQWQLTMNDIVRIVRETKNKESLKERTKHLSSHPVYEFIEKIFA